MKMISILVLTIIPQFSLSCVCVQDSYITLVVQANIKFLTVQYEPSFSENEEATNEKSEISQTRMDFEISYANKTPRVFIDGSNEFSISRK